MESRNDKPFSKNPKPWLKTPLGYCFVGLVAAFFSVGLYAGAQYLYQKYVSQKVVAQGPLDNPALADTNDIHKDFLIKSSKGFRLVSKRVGPAVVTIKSIKKRQMQQRFNQKRGQSPFDEEDPFHEFFERFGLPPGFGFHGQQQPQMGLGSGIIIDKKGHVVTNNHVVAGADEIIVNFANQRIDRKAKIIGTDPRSDLAVLKIKDLENLPEPIVWADSDKVEVGDWAIAIGSPFNIGQSVTVGIISAKGRTEPPSPGGDEYIGDLLQTDAAINPGNSGGPLCDIDGKVIGVNRAIFTKSGGYMGIGFAIPSNLAKYVVNTLVSEGKIIRGWLGVYIQPVQPELAKDLGIKEGVSIHEVIEDSPAEKAGLQAGDVITAVEGKDIKDPKELQSVVTKKKPGNVVKLRVMSYGSKKKKTVRVKIGELPSKQPQVAKSESPSKPDKMGLVVSPTKKKQGVIVEYLEPGSVGSQMGLVEGDIILKINRKKINSVAAYKKAIKSARRLYVQIKRKDRKLFFQFIVPK